MKEMKTTAQVLVDCLEAEGVDVMFGIPGEETLNESVIDRLFTGTDDGVLKDFRKELKSGISARDKEKMLEELDAMIDSSNRVLTVSSFKEWLVAAGLGVLTGGLTDVIRVVYRAATGDDRKKFREACMDLRAEVKAAKVK
jgi:hypothetical protein